MAEQKVICNKFQTGECKDKWCDEATPHVPHLYYFPYQIECTTEQHCQKANLSGAKCVPVINKIKS